MPDVTISEERLRELEDALCKAEDQLFAAASDIWQTARANQRNLTGADPLFPSDDPCPSSIGSTVVHQIGINESLRVAANCRSVGSSIAVLRAAREKAGKAPVTRKPLAWMELDENTIREMSDEDWKHYANGGCLCAAHCDSECVCGAWRERGEE